MQKSSEPTWSEKFEEEYRKQWEEHTQRLEEVIWGTKNSISYNEWREQFKQQHMTPVSINSPELVEKVVKAISSTGECSRELTNYVKDSVLPYLAKQGVHFHLDTPKENVQSTLTAQLAPDQSTGEAYAKTGTVYSSTTQIVNPDIKPFLMIDINAIKNKRYTTEEIIQIFEQTGIQVLQKYPTRGMTFGQATEASQDGKKLARSNWNGKNMFMYYVAPNSYPSVTNVAKSEFGEYTQYEAYFALKNAHGTVSTWVPSVNDCLAKDWYIVE